MKQESTKWTCSYITTSVLCSLLWRRPKFFVTVFHANEYHCTVCKSVLLNSVTVTFKQPTISHLQAVCLVTGISSDLALLVSYMALTLLCMLYCSQHQILLAICHSLLQLHHQCWSHGPLLHLDLTASSLSMNSHTTRTSVLTVTLLICWFALLFNACICRCFALKNIKMLNNLLSHISSKLPCNSKYPKLIFVCADPFPGSYLQESIHCFITYGTLQVKRSGIFSTCEKHSSAHYRMLCQGF